MNLAKGAYFLFTFLHGVSKKYQTRSKELDELDSNHSTVTPELETLGKTGN